MEQVKALRANLDKLGENDRAFANSLLGSVGLGFNMSSKQAYWIGKLLERATRPAADPVNVGNFAAVITLFQVAGAHLKFPKIRLQLPDGSPLVLSVAGERSKNAGSVNVTDGGPYGANRWYGRVSPDGAWTPSQHATGELTTVLARLATDPVGAACEFGKLTGRCCFCNIALTDGRSVDVGYGPICAEHYGLPWGERKAA